MIQLPKAFLDAPIAHRGYHDVQNGRPENSRAAFQAAISMGYGIEVAVQLSLDDQAMVFHDEELQRLTGQEGLVRSRPQTDLASIPLLHGSETIPGLSEILDLVAGQVPLLIEIKDQDGGMGPNVGPLEAAVAAAIASYEGPLAVMSFNPNAIRAFLQHTQAWPVGLVTSSYEESAWAELEPEVCHHLRNIPDYEELGARDVAQESSKGNQRLGSLLTP